MLGSSDKEEENDEEDDDDDELDEEELIKQMLAKEQQKLSQENSDDEDAVADDGDDDEEDGKGDDGAGKSVSEAATDSEHFSEQTLSSSNVASSVASTTTSTVKRSSSTTSSTSASSTASQYPVSSTGRCPYCGSSDVKYIIVVSENTKDSELPQSLQQLLTGNHAFKMAKGEVHWEEKQKGEVYSYACILMTLDLVAVRPHLLVLGYLPYLHGRTRNSGSKIKWLAPFHVGNSQKRRCNFSTLLSLFS